MNKKITYQNLWDTAKMVLGGKNQTFHLKRIGKGEKIKQRNRKKKITKPRMEINRE